MFIETERVGGFSARKKKKQLKEDRRREDVRPWICHSSPPSCPHSEVHAPVFLVRNLNVKMEGLTGDQIVLICGGSQRPQAETPVVIPTG